MKFAKLGNITLSESGKAYLSLRRIFPSKDGSLINFKYDQVIEIFATDDFKKDYDKQVKHANLTFDQLCAFKEKCEKKKEEARTSGKTPTQIQSMQLDY